MGNWKFCNNGYLEISLQWVPGKFYKRDHFGKTSLKDNELFCKQKGQVFETFKFWVKLSVKEKHDLSWWVLMRRTWILFIHTNIGKKVFGKSLDKMLSVLTKLSHVNIKKTLSSSNACICMVSASCKPSYWTNKLFCLSSCFLDATKLPLIFKWVNRKIRGYAIDLIS